MPTERGRVRSGALRAGRAPGRSRALARDASDRRTARRDERGQASVEAVLTLPFLLLLVILAENSAVLMNARMAGTIDARTHAWQAALAGGCGSAGRALVGCNDRDGRDWLTRMERAGGFDAAGVTRELRRAPAPRLTRVTETKTFRPFGDERLTGALSLESHHALSANRAWEQPDLPIGHDRFLKRALGSMGSVFPDLFPRTR